MSTSHSLNFSNPPPVNIKRQSNPTQLPLPATLTSVVSPPPGANASPTKGGTGTPTSANNNNVPQSPTSSRFSGPSPAFPPHHQPPHSTSTHAGGIQPSASFFRPSRPNHQVQYTRPSSEMSVSEIPDVVQLAPLTKHPSISSDEPSGSVGGHTIDDQQHKSSPTKRMQQSREPLLPISGRLRPSGPTTRPSMTGVSGGSNPTSPLSTSTGRLVRNSFERVFSLRRGLSFDSVRKSTSTRDNPSLAPPPRATWDEEHGMFDIPGSPTYKGSPSPVHFTQSLGAMHSTPSPSPDPSFNPQRPDREPPLSAIPILDPQTHKPMRNHEFHPSRNRFFFRGRFLTGGDSPWAFVGAFLLMLSIAGVWFGTTCVWWWNNETPAVAIVGAYLTLITITSMLAAATSDPGILPRNLDPDPPYPATSPSDGGMRAPMPRDLKVRSDVVRVKYCPTCKTYRPPRSSHCKMCDNCVDGCDHHCQWVNNCIGRRNYPSFFILLLSATITLILVICTSVLHLFLLAHREDVDFRQALGRGAGSAVAFLLAAGVIWPVGALLSYHMRLLLLNVTTIEQIRNQAHKTLVPGPPPPNPFSHGTWRRNVIAVLCRPAGYSWLDGAGIATEDKREVNPGLMD